MSFCLSEVGGGAAPTGAYPWMSAVLDKRVTNVFAAYHCGGTLIQPHWVMTSALCVEGRKGADIQVVVGATDLNASGPFRSPRKGRCHPIHFQAKSPPPLPLAARGFPLLLLEWLWCLSPWK